MTENNFRAGRVFEPLPDGMTRVKTYAEGGALLSNVVMPTAEALKLIGLPVPSWWSPDQETSAERQGEGSAFDSNG